MYVIMSSETIIKKIYLEINLQLSTIKDWYWDTVDHVDDDG